MRRCSAARALEFLPRRMGNRLHSAGASTTVQVGMSPPSESATVPTDAEDVAGRLQDEAQVAYAGELGGSACGRLPISSARGHALNVSAWPGSLRRRVRQEEERGQENHRGRGFSHDTISSPDRNECFDRSERRSGGESLALDVTGSGSGNEFGDLGSSQDPVGGAPRVFEDRVRVKVAPGSTEPSRVSRRTAPYLLCQWRTGRSVLANHSNSCGE